MKLNKFNYKKLSHYDHPAIRLFRGIELSVVIQELKNLKLKAPSMDLGSGDGFISSIIFKDKFTYGVDNDEANDSVISIQKKRYKKVLIESAEKMSLDNNSVNFVFSNSVIEHIPNNKAVLSEVSRILKTDGYFIFTCPSSFFTSYLTHAKGEYYTKYRNKMLNHYHLLSKEEWTKRLKKAGLKVLSYSYYMNQQTLSYWDLIVWVSKILALFGPIGKKITNSLFSKKVANLVKKNQVSPDEGANILIIAQK